MRFAFLVTIAASATFTGAVPQLIPPEFDHVGQPGLSELECCAPAAWRWRASESWHGAKPEAHRRPCRICKNPPLANGGGCGNCGIMRPGLPYIRPNHARSPPPSSCASEQCNMKVCGDQESQPGCNTHKGTDEQCSKQGTTLPAGTSSNPSTGSAPSTVATGSCKTCSVATTMVGPTKASSPHDAGSPTQAVSSTIASGPSATPTLAHTVVPVAGAPQKVVSAAGLVAAGAAAVYLF